jgi:Mn-dependent DtxR family transcriptional regulator
MYFRHVFPQKMITTESASVKKMISDLSSEGFLFHEDYDEINEYRFGKLHGRRRLDNVVFEKEGVILKIYKDLFFRVTGLSHLFDEVSQKPVRVSDEEFYEMLKHIIRYRYEQQIKNPKHSEHEVLKDFHIKT